MLSKICRVAVLVGAATLTRSAGAFAAPPTYHCVGFDEPIHNEMNIPKGRVLPLRGKLAIDGGGFANAETIKAAPKVRVMFVTDKGEVDRTDQIDVRDYGKGTSFVWDAEAHWKFDLGTLKFAESGKYRAELLSGDEAEYKVDPICSAVFILR